MAFRQVTIVDTGSGRVIVATKATLYWLKKPHTSVMPHGARDFLRSGGVQLHYNTSDPAILQKLHASVAELVEAVGLPDYTEFLALGGFHPRPEKAHLVQHVARVDGIDEAVVFERVTAAVAQVKIGTSVYLVARYRSSSDDPETATMLAASVVNELFDANRTPFARENPELVLARVAALAREGIEFRQLLTDALRADAVLRCKATGEVNRTAVERALALRILVPGGGAPNPAKFVMEARAFHQRILAETNSL